MEGEVVSKTLIIARVDKKEKRVWKEGEVVSESNSTAI